MKTFLAALLLISAPVAHAATLVQMARDFTYGRLTGYLQATGGATHPRFFVAMYGIQDETNQSEHSHTFASLIRVGTDGQRQVQTISWLPADIQTTGAVCSLSSPLAVIPGLNACTPVTGRNFNFAETVAMVVEHQRSLRAWTPFEVDEYLYDLLRARAQELEDGTYQYVADDRIYRQPGIAMNCMHSISDVDGVFAPLGGFLNNGLKMWGFHGTDHILKVFADRHAAHIVDWSVNRNDFHTFFYTP